MPLLKRNYSFFHFLQKKKKREREREKKKKFNLDSANTLITSKAVKQKEE